MDELDMDMDTDLDEARMLARARRGLAPTLLDEQRVLAATSLALESAGATLHPTGAHVGLALKLAAVLTVAVGSGATGYYFGARAVHAKPALSAVVAAPVRQPAPRAVARPATSASGVLAMPPLAAVDLRNGAQLGAPSAAPARERPTERATAQAWPLDADTPELGMQSLQAELDALRRVEQALRGHKPRVALSVLDELERTVPHGQLQEERLAAFVMARCALGLGSHAALAGEFTRNYPRSVYRGRVERGCALPTR